MGGGFEKSWKKYTPAGLAYTGLKKVMGTDDKGGSAVAKAAAPAAEPVISSRASILGSLLDEDGTPLTQKRPGLFGN